MNPLRDRVAAAADSLRLDYEGLAGVQFIRFCAYRDIRDHLTKLKLEKCDVLEIGASNGVIASFLPARSHIVTGDYPATDVCNMPEQPSGRYDAVILDQVLEHVREPERALSEVHRVLRPGGLLILAVPFLIRLHSGPADYWRFAPDGLAQLLSRFVDVRIRQWGNRMTIDTCMKYGWLYTWQTRRRLRALLRNEADWPVVIWAIATR